MFRTSPTPKPKTRSSIRKYWGKKYFVMKRWWKWQKEKKDFSKTQKSISLNHLVFKHESTLLRKLKNVDMWLQHNKITNLQLAIDRLDGIVIQPNETFSFWHLVGNPTKKRGFKTGMVLENGKVKEGTGGGLCQLGNLLFWMTLHSPLTISERWRHSFDVFPDVNRKIPFGCGATLSYNYIDFQLKNETQQAFQFKLWLSDTKLHGKLLSEFEPTCSYEVYEAEHRMQQEVWGGYTRHNIIYRKVLEKEHHTLISDEPIVENHAIMMYSPLLEN
ncbi:MAG: vancomycin resistance protein VanW [Flammeovirgaceae bacterium]|jgi:vancomycin resistance protein VanW